MKNREFCTYFRPPTTVLFPNIRSRGTLLIEQTSGEGCSTGVPRLARVLGRFVLRAILFWRLFLWDIDAALPSVGRPKTKAARASHPSRFVIADASVCLLPPEGGRSLRRGVPKNTMRQCLLEAHASSFRIQHFHPALEGGLRKRPQRPGTSSLDMNRNSSSDSPSRESPAR